MEKIKILDYPQTTFDINNQQEILKLINNHNTVFRQLSYNNTEYLKTEYMTFIIDDDIYSEMEIFMSNADLILTLTTSNSLDTYRFFDIKSLKNFLINFFLDL